MSDSDTKPYHRARALIWAGIAVVFVVLWVLWSFGAAFFTTLFLAVLALKVKAAYPLAASVALLAICPFLLVLEQEGAAGFLAECSYYFMALGVVLLFVDHVRLSWRNDKGESRASDDEAQGTE